MPKTDLSRRNVLRASGAAAFASTIPLSGCGSSPELRPPSGPGINPPAIPTIPAKHLNQKQYDSLAALVDRLIPEDTDPGATIARCVDFIDAFLGAFDTSPPFIYAGAPFSDRGGNPTNDFQAFIELDKYEELAWRTVIEGSQGIAEREVNGAVTGLQQIYADGLAHLDTRAQEQGVNCFSELTPAQRDAIISDNSDGAVSGFVGTVFGETVKAMYGAPEYYGNHDLVGWGFTSYDGDVHPRGFTADQVVNADNPGPLDDTLPASYHEVASNNPSAQQKPNAQSKSAKATSPGEFNPPPFESGTATIPAYASADEMSFIIANSGGDINKLKELMAPYIKHLQGRDA